MSPGIEDTPQKPLSCWPLAFSAGLLGIGQNGLLVVLPVLFIQTNLSLGCPADARLNAVSAIVPVVGKANFPYWQ